MAIHSYTPEQALEAIMGKLRARDESLADQVQQAIDAGKDVEEFTLSRDRRKKARVYRKKVPFSSEEALRVALDALQSYFVELSLFVESASDNFARAAIGSPIEEFPTWASSPATITNTPEPLELVASGQPKRIVIELETETQLSRTQQEPFLLKAMSKVEITLRQNQITALRELTDFTEK